MWFNESTDCKQTTKEGNGETESSKKRIIAEQVHVKSHTLLKAVQSAVHHTDTPWCCAFDDQSEETKAGLGGIAFTKIETRRDRKTKSEHIHERCRNTWPQSPVRTH